MKFRMVHNNLNVFDLDKSIKFYQDAFDMPVAGEGRFVRAAEDATEDPANEGQIIGIERMAARCKEIECLSFLEEDRLLGFGDHQLRFCVEILDMTALDEEKLEKIKKTVKAEAAKLGVSLVLKPDVVKNILMLIGE